MTRNPANQHKFEQSLLQPKIPASNGISSLGVGGVPRFAVPAQQLFCVRTQLIHGDPNSNGGYDSNGYAVAYREDARFPFVGTHPSTDPNQVRIVPAVGPLPQFPPSTLVWVYGYSQTFGSPTPADDGFMMCRPIGLYSDGSVSADNVFIVQTGTTGTYPVQSDGCNIFPCYLPLGLSFDDSSCTNTLNFDSASGTDGGQGYVLNLAGGFIPSGTNLIAIPIPGITGSKTPHFCTYYALPLPRTVWGTLAGTLSGGGPVSCNVVTTANGPAPSGSIEVTDPYPSTPLTGSSGDDFSAIEDVLTGAWYFLTIQCPS